MQLARTVAAGIWRVLTAEQGSIDLLVEARRRAEQLADAGRAEAFRPAAAQPQVGESASS